jgi:hypothetical protein
MVCRNICRRLVSKPSFEYNQYILGKKYCRRCEVYIYHHGLFCPCCGMQLRRTPASKNGKERLRRKKKMLITNSQNWLTANSNYWLCYPPDLKEPLIWSASGRLKNDSTKIKFRTDFKSPILFGKSLTILSYYPYENEDMADSRMHTGPSPDTPTNNRCLKHRYIQLYRWSITDEQDRRAVQNFSAESPTYR